MKSLNLRVAQALRNHFLFHFVHPSIHVPAKLSLNTCYVSGTCEASVTKLNESSQFFWDFVYTILETLNLNHSSGREFTTPKERLFCWWTSLFVRKCFFMLKLNLHTYPGTSNQSPMGAPGGNSHSAWTHSSWVHHSLEDLCENSTERVTTWVIYFVYAIHLTLNTVPGFLIVAQ